MGYRPTNKYLPPRHRTSFRSTEVASSNALAATGAPESKLLRWLDQLFSR
jgi:hypothetical protein